MKTYIDNNATITFGELWIPKDPANIHYARFLEELEKEQAELVSLTPTWEEIRAKRDHLLKDSDWSVTSDATPKPSKEAWIAYRQALRDLPQNFSVPQEVIWPVIETNLTILDK
jgi:hypothetical protein